MNRQHGAATAVSDALSRIESSNEELHAFVTVLGEEAERTAAEIDGRAASPRAMEATLVGVKDNIDVAGAPTTCGLGSRALEIARQDAAVVSQLRAAGAVVIGKLNMHEGALGTDSANPHFGHVGNPSAPHLSPGGSSGGSAAAVAAHLCDVALGTDTLGSIRIPASFCDVVGYKPSRGRVCNHGLVTLWDQFDVIGPIARTVDEIITVAAVLLGRPVDDGPDSVTLATIENLDCLEVHRDVVERLEPAIDIATQVSDRAITISLDPSQITRTRRAAFTLAELGAAHAYGRDLEVGSAGLSSQLEDLLRFGASLTASSVAKSLSDVANAVIEYGRLFDRADLIMCPTAPVLPFKRGATPPPNVVDLTMPWSILGAPAISLPTFRSHDSPPIGVQIVGRPGDDETVLRFAQQLVGVI